MSIAEKDVGEAVRAIKNTKKSIQIHTPEYSSLAQPNCYATGHDDVEAPRYFSTPFITALAGLMLLKMDSNHIAQPHIDQTRTALIRNLSCNKMARFFNDLSCPFDLDTTAIVNLFLIESGAYSDSDIQSLIESIKNNQYMPQNPDSPCVGAFYTWIDKNPNHVDFFVNVNVYVFLSRMGLHNKPLAGYLTRNIENFLLNGSRYYKNVEFPIFLLAFYFNSGLISINDAAFRKIFNAIRANNKTKKLFAGFLDDRFKEYTNLSRTTAYYVFSQYFNDSSGRTYHSPMLGKVINQYLRQRLSISNQITRTLISQK